MTNYPKILLINLNLFSLADNQNGTLVATTIPDGGGHRQLERPSAGGETDQCGADRAAGGAAACGDGGRNYNAIPEDADPCADDAALYFSYNLCDTPVAGRAGHWFARGASPKGVACR